jgi:hypothetical protein
LEAIPRHRTAEPDRRKTAGRFAAKVDIDFNGMFDSIKTAVGVIAQVVAIAGPLLA